LINEYVVRPFVFLFRGLDAAERRWVRLLGARRARGERSAPAAGEELS
jgi:hypothetical protein